MLFVEFPTFTKTIVQLSDEDYAAFQRDLAASPEQGDVMRGAGGFRKVRMGFPGAGIGKSGGARVIYLYLPDVQIIVLVLIYAKAKKVALTKAEEGELRLLAGEIKHHFSTGRD